jgi:hypothetical protein
MEQDTTSTELASVDTFIQKAIETGATVETLDRLFELQQKARAAAAKQSFIRALAAFQAECPIIEKKNAVKNQDGTLRYKFASIDSIVRQIQKPLAKHGLSYRWEIISDPKERLVTAAAILTHIAGHSEASSFVAPIEEGKVSRSGYKLTTAPQDAATALTYAKRYSLCAVLGIATGEEDTDATDSGRRPDAKDPKAKIVIRLRTLGEKTGSKDEIEEAVKRLAKLALAPANFEEIVTRLDVIIHDRQEATN